MPSQRWGGPVGATVVGVADRTPKYPSEDVLLRFSNGSVWLVRVLQVVRVADASVDGLMAKGVG